MAAVVAAGFADEAGEVNAVAAVGAAGRHSGVVERKVRPVGFFAMEAALAAGDRADDAAADAQAGSDLALREVAHAEQAIDFVDEGDGEHGGGGVGGQASGECGVRNGEWGMQGLVGEPEVAGFR